MQCSATRAALSAKRCAVSRDEQQPETSTSGSSKRRTFATLCWNRRWSVQSVQDAGRAKEVRLGPLEQDAPAPPERSLDYNKGARETAEIVAASWSLAKAASADLDGWGAIACNVRIACVRHNQQGLAKRRKCLLNENARHQSSLRYSCRACSLVISPLTRQSGTRHLIC